MVRILKNLKLSLIRYTNRINASNRVIASVVEWLKRRAYDQHGLGSKPTCAILLCPWERHFTALFPACWSWEAVLNFNHISIKLPADSNTLASPEAGWGNCPPMY